MTTENEIKILDIDKDKAEKTLLEIGFIKQEPQDFRRRVYDPKRGGERSWYRLRSDGKKTTLAYKSFEKDAIDGVQELEIVVDDFEKAHEMLLLLGLEEKSYQENRRQRYLLDEIEVSIDEWPLIPAYLEIEAPTKAAVEKYLVKLNGDHKKVTSELTPYVYSLYGYALDSYRHLAFEL
jgi:adenylate cyclase class 2